MAEISDAVVRVTIDSADRDAVIHMLLAQREQINAALRLLTKEEPASAEPTKPAPRRFGQRPTDGG